MLAKNKGIEWDRNMIKNEIEIETKAVEKAFLIPKSLVRS